MTELMRRRRALMAQNEEDEMRYTLHAVEFEISSATASGVLAV